MHLFVSGTVIQQLLFPQLNAVERIKYYEAIRAQLIYCDACQAAMYLATFECHGSKINGPH